MPGQITTQAQLRRASNARRVWLVEPEPRQILTDWQAAYSTTSQGADPLSLLEAASDIVKLGGYRSGTAPASATIGAAGPAGYLAACPCSTVNAAGCRADHFRVHVFSRPSNLASFKISIWRWAAGSGSARVLSCVYSQECIGQLANTTGWQSIPVTGSYVTALGDIPAVSFAWASDTPVNFFGLSSATFSYNWPYPSRLVTVKGASAPTFPQFDWGTGSTTVYDYILPVEVWGSAPVLVNIGDSISEGGYTEGHSLGADPGEFWGMSWEGKIGINAAYNQQAIAFNYLAQEYGWSWSDMAIGGEGLLEMAARFDSDVIAKKPKAVVIMGGVNDALNENSLDDCMTALRGMIQKCVNDGIYTIVAAMFDIEITYEHYSTEVVAKIAAFRSAEQALVTEFSGVQYIDSRSALEAQGYTIDGLHLNTTAHRKWGEDIVAHVVSSPQQISTTVFKTGWAGGEYSDSDFVALEQNGTELARVETLDACKATAGTCYLDHETAMLYMRGFSDESPLTSLVAITFKQYFAKFDFGSALILTPSGSRWPVNVKKYVAEVPGYSQYLKEEIFGGATVEIGTLRLVDGASSIANQDGPLSRSIREYIYFNQRCTCRYGGEKLPYAEYEPYWTGVMQSPTFSGGGIDIGISSLTSLLEKKVPVNTFKTSEFPYLESTAEGKFIPIGFGDISNLKPTMIDTRNPVKYKLFDHRGGGVSKLRWQGIDFTDGLQSFDAATSVATVLYDTTKTGGVVTADAAAYTDSEGVTPRSYGGVAKALLRMRLSDSQIDLDSFSAVDALRPYGCGLLVEQQSKIDDIISQLDASYLCFHGQSRAGKIYARAIDFTFSPVEASVSVVRSGEHYYFRLQGHGFHDQQTGYFEGFSAFVPGRYYIAVVDVDTFLLQSTSNPDSVFFATEGDSGLYLSQSLAADIPDIMALPNLTEVLDYGLIYSAVTFGYSPNWCIQADTAASPTGNTSREDWSFTCRYLQQKTNITAALYGCVDTLPLQSLIASKADAQAMADLRAGLHMMPIIKTTFDYPISPYSIALGDLVRWSGSKYMPAKTIGLVTGLWHVPDSSVCTIRAIAPAMGYIG